MSLRTKFGLGIIFVFMLLAISIGVTGFFWINYSTLREEEQDVQMYIRSSWEIFNSKLDRMETILEILAHDQQLASLLTAPANNAFAPQVRVSLEPIRQQQNMDVLNVMDARGKVLVRTRAPYNVGDSVADDPLVRRVIATHASAAGTILLSQDRLERGGADLAARAWQAGGQAQGMLLSVAMPVIVNGELIGILQMGNLLNGSSDKVDRIRDTVFQNEMYHGKPFGTATIFMGDVRISTNVLNHQGERALGTRAAPDVAEQVLKRGKPWTGRAWVVDTWYIAQYDPIRDPDGNVIGMLYVGELEQKYLDLRTQGLLLFLGVTFAGMIVAFAIFFAIVRGVVKPIEELAIGTKRLASGELDYRVAPRANSRINLAVGKDEVRNLAVSFDEMAAQLQKQRAEIEDDHRALAKLNTDLQTTNRNYMEMLGFVAHELKNPLSSAILNVGTVKDGYIGEVNPTQKEALEAVARNLRYFREMIADYLDLSRIEKGELWINPAPIHLRADVVAPALDSLARSLQEKKFVLENQVAPEIGLHADRDLLRIVYDNLLSNTVKYGKEGGRVLLEAHADAHGTITASVWNEGNGIAPDKLPLLFQKFSRVAAPEHARKKGTGLGLYICREIIEKHGGKIWAESELGAWTRFVFVLPAQRAA